MKQMLTSVVIPWHKKNACLKIKALSIEICNRNFKIRKIKMSSYYDKMKIV